MKSLLMALIICGLNLPPSSQPIEYQEYHKIIFIDNNLTYKEQNSKTWIIKSSPLPAYNSKCMRLINKDGTHFDIFVKEFPKINKNNQYTQIVYNLYRCCDCYNIINTSDSKCACLYKFKNDDKNLEYSDFVEKVIKNRRGYLHTQRFKTKNFKKVEVDTTYITIFSEQ